MSSRAFCSASVLQEQSLPQPQQGEAVAVEESIIGQPSHGSWVPANSSAGHEVQSVPFCEQGSEPQRLADWQADSLTESTFSAALTRRPSVDLHGPAGHCSPVHAFDAHELPAHASEVTSSLAHSFLSHALAVQALVAQDSPGHTFAVHVLLTTVVVSHDLLEHVRPLQVVFVRA